MQVRDAKSGIFCPKTKKRTCISASSYGADGRIRTGDLILTNGMSYSSTSSKTVLFAIFAHIAGRFLHEMQSLQLIAAQ